MTAQSPDAGGSPDEHDGTPSVPEDVWQRFLTDTERAIRATAPREPSARQRTTRPAPRPRAPAPGTDAGSAAPVGDLWRPDDPWEGPSWRDLDRRARVRRVGRVVGTAAAIALALGAWSHLSTGAGTPVEGPGGDGVLQQSEVAPADLPTAATSRAPGLTSPSSSGPAVQAG
ncbi:hypothetical protein HTV45_01310 [Streptomyces sp. CHD11]|uniref:hypothetical protein n=1 Tax=Streptomyces sp. CHD11 TaxID=2741325 RepID=UPI001BFCC9F7|nr:hypothetical protein [Streptomyces sp. CHD11]MBT3149559.1 hypothetical protein [Streptomyces sp. CHD11]